MLHSISELISSLNTSMPVADVGIWVWCSLNSTYRYAFLTNAKYYLLSISMYSIYIFSPRLWRYLLCIIQLSCLHYWAVTRVPIELRTITATVVVVVFTRVRSHLILKTKPSCMATSLRSTPIFSAYICDMKQNVSRVFIQPLYISLIDVASSNHTCMWY